MRVTAGQVIGTIHLCPACGGSGERRDGADFLRVRLCPQCGGSGRRGRPYQAARLCQVCGRVFQPPLEARGHLARVCHWCLASDRPIPAPRHRSACRRCGGPLERAARGRPPVLCRVCSPDRRSYTPARERGATDAQLQGQERPASRQREAPGGRAATRPGHASLPAAYTEGRAGGSVAAAGARGGSRR